MIKLLILEPNDILRSGFNAVLPRDTQIEVVGFAYTTVEAASMLDELAADVLLLDECWDAELIAAADKAGVACIVYSSQSEGELVFEALSLGAKAYILKGSSLTLLLSAIHAVGTGASWLDPAIAKKAIDVIRGARLPVSAKPPIFQPQYTILSPRETEVLSLLSQGMPNTAIAKQLYLSPETVKTHVSHIMDKLNVRSRTHAAVQGIKLGIINHERASKQPAVSC